MIAIMMMMVMTLIMKIIVNVLFFYKCVFYVLMSSVKWGHLGNFGPNSINTILSTKILWGHLGHSEPETIFHNYYYLNCELVP